MKFENLSLDFFRRDARKVAEDLLGKIIVRNYMGYKLTGRIVETEAYVGKIDKASHAYNYKKTTRTEPLFKSAGIAYVYKIYGMYNCMNIVTGCEGDPQGVLIRAIEPIEGIEVMSENRFNKPFTKLKPREILNLTSGPGKLCIALNIDKSLNTHSILSEELSLYADDFKDFKIVYSKRIGIDYAEEAKDFLWRYYIEGNKYVSVIDKKSSL
ncbi:3-methyladenine DNA glycosylase [Clostridium sulfidigenes]|uniref:Putative 3-methyladenine DNA glycosylase n=1 Tax=Clostridium sulfidigenes TaxID=318464 RepID=A0A084JBE8_9CLOT|nr:DNA-3-methyladenine glycosylase [Clostridium sulfidigenes]KEZ86282.1 3-methyladenine DNA glycosylase [Clostridium sulfidigenes]